MPKCPICHHDSTNSQIFNRDAHEIICKVCGKFIISDIQYVSLDDDGCYKGSSGKYPIPKNELYLLSAALRNWYENTKKPYELINEEAAKQLFESVNKPTTPQNILDKLITYISMHVDSFGKQLHIDPNTDYSLFYCKNNEELEYVSEYGNVKGLLKYDPSAGYTITPYGWEYLQELNNRTAASKNAFVAMWFDESMNDIWISGYKNILESSELGYYAVRIDKKEHNNKIDDEIIAEIRKCGLLIADFTGNRGGVYFEAGFAMGLSIPVIWTCSNHDIDKVHFDTRQYNHIVYDDPSDLAGKLKKRIQATIAYPNRPT